MRSGPRRRLYSLALAAAVALAVALPTSAQDVAGDRFDVVVLDAGHGGEDEGARGSGGLIEKEIVLDVARRVAEQLERRGIEVVLTRPGDAFVPLERRTSIANDARGDLFLSIHANASRSTSPRGMETYFAHPDASDEDARRLADLENSAFGDESAHLPSLDPLAAILGDMAANQDHLESDEIAKLVQSELARVDSAPSRGVKQAPFVVLMGVRMPASLVEIGFLTNRQDERGLRRSDRRDAIADALAKAVLAFGHRYDERRGVQARLEVPASRGD